MLNLKYKNKKINDGNGNIFDSKKEYNRYLELKEKENKKEISNLQRQVEYILIPRQTDKENNKFLFHPIKYVADFVYTNNNNGEQVVEDSKGYKTEIYKMKKKMMYYMHGIKIYES